MHFQQRQLTRATLLALREHGLYVCQRDGRGKIALELEMPYEEILPVRAERRRRVPRRQLVGLLFGALWLATTTLAPPAGSGAAWRAHFWGWAFAAGAGVAALFLYGLHNWWSQRILHTARAQVVLPDTPAERAAFHDFTVALERRAKTYLRREYGAVNPLGVIEPRRSPGPHHPPHGPGAQCAPYQPGPGLGPALCELRAAGAAGTLSFVGGERLAEP